MRTFSDFVAKHSEHVSKYISHSKAIDPVIKKHLQSEVGVAKKQVASDFSKGLNQYNSALASIDSIMKKLSGQSISGFYVKPADYHLFMHTADKMIAIRNEDKAYLHEDDGKITMKELLVKYTEAISNPEILDNLKQLHKKINKLRKRYGKPLIVTSGLRSLKHHIEIYKKNHPGQEVPMKSKHLFGQAVDISDKKGKLKEWCKKNEDFLVEEGFYMEAFSHTSDWVHFQIVPPASGNRYFIPWVKK